MMRRDYIAPFAIVFAGAVLLAGCGGGSSAEPPISVNISPPSAKTVDQGQSITFNATVTNDASNKGVTWSVSCSASPCGTLSNQTATATIYVAPRPVTASQSVTITATSNANPGKSASNTVTVVAPPSITTTSLPGGTGGSAYSAILQESGGIAPFTWSFASGSSLPAGLSLNTDGTIGGTPTAGGTSKFTVQVADSGNPPLTASANLSIAVVVLPLSITTLSLPNATLNTAYKQPVQAAGGIPPYTWSIASGTFPPWATLNGSTGVISGIPGATDTSSFTMQVADSESTALTSTQALSITTVAASSANNSELSGHYAFVFNGFDDATGFQVAVAGSFTADGKGKITAGIEDENGPSGAALNVPFTGTYNIGSDHRGAFTLATAVGSRTYALVLNSISSAVAQKARFVEFDDTTGTTGQRGSGVLRLQDPAAFSRSKITGPYAFGFQGQDASGNREAMVGSFNADGAGTIPSGIADENVAGTTNNPSLTGNYAAPSSTNGRATLQLIASGAFILDLSAYVVSGTELLAMTTDTFSADGLVSGTILSQNSTSFSSSSLDGAAVYYQLGVNPSAAKQSFAEIGLFSADGNGNLSAVYDKQLGGGVSGPALAFAATYSVISAGRVSISDWYGDTTSPVRVLYLVDKNKAFFMETSAGVGFGFVEEQTAAPSGGFSNGSLSGAFSTATIAPSVSGNLNGAGMAALDGSGGFSQSTNLTTSSGLFVDQMTSGTYSISANGRGVVKDIAVTTAGVSTSMFALAVAAAICLSQRKTRRNTSRPGVAVFCFTIWIATIPAACPPPKVTNQLVFYLISPHRAVLMHQQSFNPTPEVSLIEQ